MHVVLPLVLHGHLVIETILDWWSDAKVASIVLLASLSQNVGRRVPEHSLALLVLKIQQLKFAR